METVALALALLVQELALPALTGRVVDNADVLTAEEERSLVARLETLERETSTQIVVVTIPTLGGETLEDYSFRLAEAWGIGQEEPDNGVVVLAVVSDRRARIEVGYGLEAVIPDGLAGRIIRERMVPAFRQGDFYAGLNGAVEGLELAARREYPEAPPPRSSSERRIDVGGLVITFILSGIVGAALGTFGAVVLGAFLGYVFTGLAWWGIPLGALLGLLARLTLRGGPGAGGGWTYHPVPGGFWRRGGGGFSGGGFRGGGGGFGGGGASGSW